MLRWAGCGYAGKERDRWYGFVCWQDIEENGSRSQEGDWLGLLDEGGNNLRRGRWNGDGDVGGMEVRI